MGVVGGRGVEDQRSDVVSRRMTLSHILELRFL